MAAEASATPYVIVALLLVVIAVLGLAIWSIVDNAWYLFNELP